MSSETITNDNDNDRYVAIGDLLTQPHISKPYKHKNDKQFDKENPPSKSLSNKFDITIQVGRRIFFTIGFELFFTTCRSKS